jgi:hypothetical protein
MTDAQSIEARRQARRIAALTQALYQRIYGVSSAAMVADLAELHRCADAILAVLPEPWTEE